MDALDDFLVHYEEKKIVAFMGGHTLPRYDQSYKQIAYISKQLTEDGYLMTSGGGPGAMEATHLGAWFAGRSEKDLEKAFDILSVAPDYHHPLWLDKAFEVLSIYPTTAYKSLGVPTWLYGHEPSTPFATHIAKFFDNSIREDSLLSIAKGGIVFAPGSAGTLQEIFQEATQNHYLTFGYASPMIFLNKSYWTKELPAYNFLHDMLQKGKYKNLLLSIDDDSKQIINTIKSFSKTPVQV
jgi:predicted Rossmann-fold nucleotide-binding protein